MAALCPSGASHLPLCECFCNPKVTSGSGGEGEPWGGVEALTCHGDHLFAIDRRGWLLKIGTGLNGTLPYCTYGG